MSFSLEVAEERMASIARELGALDVRIHDILEEIESIDSSQQEVSDLLIRVKTIQEEMRRVMESVCVGEGINRCVQHKAVLDSLVDRVGQLSTATNDLSVLRLRMEKLEGVEPKIIEIEKLLPILELKLRDIPDIWVDITAIRKEFEQVSKDIQSLCTAVEKLSSEVKEPHRFCNHGKDASLFFSKMTAVKGIVLAIITYVAGRYIERLINGN